MLASKGLPLDITKLQEQDWIFDLKIDGVRCLATITNGEVSLVSRQGVTLTTQYPEIAADLRTAAPRGHWVIDGEISVNDDRGLPSWPLTAKRNAQVRNTSGWAAKLPATLYAFDLLVSDGVDVRTWALSTRRALLETQGETWGVTGVRNVLSTLDGNSMWEVVMKYDLEGLVAKRPGSEYRDGRSHDWVKIKRTSTVTCMVGGFTPGEGSRSSTFGNLHLYLADDDGVLVPVGKVGSGFSNSELRAVTNALGHPPVIVEVEYLDVSPDGFLRQPVFQRLRRDAVVGDCTLSQLQ